MQNLYSPAWAVLSNVPLPSRSIILMTVTSPIWMTSFAGTGHDWVPGLPTSPVCEPVEKPTCVLEPLQAPASSESCRVKYTSAEPALLNWKLIVWFQSDPFTLPPPTFVTVGDDPLMFSTGG